MNGAQVGEAWGPGSHPGGTVLHCHRAACARGEPGGGRPSLGSILCAVEAPSQGVLDFLLQKGYSARAEKCLCFPLTTEDTERLWRAGGAGDAEQTNNSFAFPGPGL